MLTKFKFSQLEIRSLRGYYKQKLKRIKEFHKKRQSFKMQFNNLNRFQDFHQSCRLTRLRKTCKRCSKNQNAAQQSNNKQILLKHSEVSDFKRSRSTKDQKMASNTKISIGCAITKVPRLPWWMQFITTTALEVTQQHSGKFMGMEETHLRLSSTSLLLPNSRY